MNLNQQSQNRQNRMIQIILYNGFIDWRMLYELLSAESGYEINPNVLNFDLHRLLSEKKIKRVGEGFRLSDYEINEDGMIIFK